MKKLPPAALAILSGVLYFVGFIGFDQWYLEWIALVPLIFALDGIATGKRAFFVSWLMGWVTHLGGYYWVIHLLMDFGNLALPLAVLGYALLCALQGALFAVFGFVVWKLKNRTGVAIGWIVPVALIATEFAYPLIFQSYTANSQAWMPLFIQIVDLGGVLLLSGVIALVNSAVAEIGLAHLHGRPVHRALPIAAAGALLFTIGYGLVRMPQIDARDAKSEQLKVAIVQANVGESDKHLKIKEGIERYRNMTESAINAPGVGLVVWPESAFNSYVERGANLTSHIASNVKVPMLIGAVRVEGGREPGWNSMLSVATGGDVIASYDKVKLLVFGEYQPGYETFPRFYEWLLQQGLLPYLSIWNRGTSFDSLPVGAYRISADICYEDILPRHIRKLMRRVDVEGRPAHAMFNGTNDSWYGPVEPRIHLALSVFRSVEHRRWLIRSTSTGISAFIDANGRIVARTDFEKAQLLLREVPMIVGGPTIYAIVGDVLGWLALFAIIVGLFWRKRQRPS